MDYAAALAKLRTLEVDGAADLVSAFEDKVTAIEGKGSELIAEKRNLTQRNLDLGGTLDAIAKGLNLKGVLDRDANGTYLLGEKAGELPVVVQDLRRGHDDLKAKAETYEQQLSEAQAKVQASARKDRLAELAVKAGANAAVLERLFPDLDALAVSDDGTVTLADKPLREAIEADPSLAAFAPALFVAAPTDPKPAPRLPSGGPGGPPQPKNPAKEAISRLKFAVPGQKN